jgi:Phosphotransferase enzyme family
MLDGPWEQWLRRSLGSAPVAGVERLAGGSKKGVYRVRLDDGATVVLYSWAGSESYWPASGSDVATDPFAEASGPGLFRAAYDALGRLGVPVPQLLAFDDTAAELPYAAAIVEDVTGGSLERCLAHDPDRSAAALGRLADALQRLHSSRRDDIGKLSHPVAGESCELVAVQRAKRHLDAAAKQLPELAEARPALLDVLDGLFEAVPPRRDHRLIHGELGPDHVLLDAADKPYLIDVEGLMYFDLEWEHAFLRLRFHEYYAPLRVDGLDEARLRLYALCLHLSLVAGPLQVLGGSHPEQDVFADIMRSNASAALGYL